MHWDSPVTFAQSWAETYTCILLYSTNWLYEMIMCYNLHSFSSIDYYKTDITMYQYYDGNNIYYTDGNAVML